MKALVNCTILISYLDSGLRCLVELILYIQDYNKGIMPFSTYEHRSISDSMVFLFPALLNLWLIKKTSYKIAFVIFSAVFLFLLLGTLSRGAWLAVFIVTLLWLILNRQWKLLMLTSIVISVAAVGVFTYKGDHATKDRLIYKLQQTEQFFSLYQWYSRYGVDINYGKSS